MFILFIFKGGPPGKKGWLEIIPYVYSLETRYTNISRYFQQQRAPKTSYRAKTEGMPRMPQPLGTCNLLLPWEVPSYLIVAGLVFTTLTVPFLRSEFGEEWECEAGVFCFWWFFYSLSSISCSTPSFLGSYRWLLSSRFHERHLWRSCIVSSINELKKKVKSWWFWLRS